MAQFVEYIEWCTKKGLKPNRFRNLEKFLSQVKEA